MIHNSRTCPVASFRLYGAVPTMSHKESAIPAGCFYSPSSPTMSSNPASPVSPSLPAILADQNLPGPFVDFVQSEPFTVSGLHLQTTDDSRKPDIPRSTPAEENETPVHTVRRKVRYFF